MGKTVKNGQIVNDIAAQIGPELDSYAQGHWPLG